MGLILQSARDRDGHFLLLRSELEIRTSREDALLGKNVLDLGQEASDGGVLYGADH
jgi:hypothetical protein